MCDYQKIQGRIKGRVKDNDDKNWETNESVSGNEAVNKLNGTKNKIAEPSINDWPSDLDEVWNNKWII